MNFPAAAEKDDFVAAIKRHGKVDERLRNFYQGFHRDAHPMAIMCGVVGALSGYYHNSLDIADASDRRDTAHRLIAKMPILAAMSYRHTLGLPFVPPRDDLGYAENFLHMMFAPANGDYEDYEVNPVLARAFDRIFLLHADHEQNASTSTVRLAGSTGANPYACIAAGIAALWGPAHGGANEAVLNMLAEIGTPSNIDKFVNRAKDPNDPFRIMGFGHRVYKNYDPRARVMQQTCREVLDELGVENDPTLQMAQRLEKIALEDEYFVDRRLYPNVDFYSGIILRAIGIPEDMFTVIFTTGPHSGLDRALVRDGRRTVQDRASEATLHRRVAQGLRSARRALSQSRRNARLGIQPDSTRRRRSTQTRRIPALSAERLHLRVELIDQRRHRQSRSELARRRQRHVQILAHPLDGKAKLELPLRHGLGTVVHLPALCRSLGYDVDHQTDVETRLFGEMHAFRQALDDSRQAQLVDHLR